MEETIKMAALLKLLLILLACCHHQLASAQVIKFFAMQHGYPNETLARQALAKALELTTRQPVQIDSLVPSSGPLEGHFDVAWHSTQIVGCAERPVLELLATIKHPAGPFTRDFKMFLGEEFNYPKRVEIQWLGECENLGRKRAQVSDGSEAAETSTGTGAGASTSPPVPTTIEPSEPTTTTPEPTGGAPSLAPDEPEAGTSPAEEPAAQTTTPAAAAAEPELTSTEGFMMFDLAASATTSSTPTPPTTTTTEALNPATSVPAESTLAPVSEASNATTIATESITTTSTTSTTTTTTEPTTPTPTEAPISPSRWSPITTSEPSQNTTSGPASSELPTSASVSTELPPTDLKPDAITSGASAAGGVGEPHYGKYVGLSTAFLIFIAYLVCARAYRRQGMYELHESTSSLETRS